jgi:hypothetical protein
MMKTTVSEYDFERAFIDANRADNFTYAGRKALFAYLEEYEEDTGEEIELDVIALCCEYSEYASVQEFITAYNDDFIVWDVEPEEADEEEGTPATPGEIDYEATLDKIRADTQVIDIDGESFIIQDF